MLGEVRLARFVMTKLGDADIAITELWQRVTSWRRRACPSCKRRALARMDTQLWTGIPGTVRCSTYRCRGCGTEMIAEQGGSVRTMAEHAAWREAKDMRVLEYPSAAMPTAVVRRWPPRR